VQELHLKANRCLEQGDEACEPALVEYLLESLKPNSKVIRYHEARQEAYMKRPDAVENALKKIGVAFETEQKNGLNLGL
ncbi:MAG: hypothetical protein P8L77_03305, partial [Gammaproteobacteria bacterium]|nr:hypothetical protein [Gammaproteobacteria bacterium]